MKKNDVKNVSKEFSFINFYKGINKVPVKNKIGKELNDKILSDITQMNFSFKNLNNNDINLIEQKKKLKFKTTKNTPNSSLKNIKLSFFQKEKKRKKDIYDKNNNEGRIKQKDLFDDSYIKKIKQAYNNRMKINNNFINNHYQKRSNSNNLLLNNISKSKSKEQNSTLNKKFYKFDFKENNNLNMTNYLPKSKVHFNENFLSNENNHYNNLEDRVIFTNNYNNGKEHFNENILLSSNNSNLSNTNLNNKLKESNKILLKYIENRYNNIIRNKIKDKKFAYNNMRNNHDSVKYYLKNNFSFNDKSDMNYHKRINKINNKIQNIKKLKISEKNYAKNLTPINSKNNSINKPANLKIRKNNIILENLGNNILNKKLNFFSVKNSSNNLLNSAEQSNINENSIRTKQKEENYQNRNDFILNEKKINSKTNNNNYNININNYNNIKIINDKNIKGEEIQEKYKKKKENLKKFLKDIILCIPNNNEENEVNSNLKDNNNIMINGEIEKDKNIVSKENENKITFISINNNMNITNQHQIINNYEIQLKEKLKNKEDDINTIKSKEKMIINNKKILFKENDSDINKENYEHKIKDDIINENKNEIKEKKPSENTLNNYIDININENEKKEEEDKKEELNNKEEELLCNIKKGKEEEEIEEEKSNLSQSRDCLYYQNELDKLSIYIKTYYSDKKVYPESNTKFYLFGREIGHGAFGKVNLCLHIGSGHLVAMKTFVKKDSKYKETKEKLRNEVEVLSKLHHPFINQILDNFETDTHFFIVMEYICGDLLSFIRKRNKLNEQISKMIFKQLIEGLKYIHKKNIIHRDIKLDNILIDTTNTVKICDFGVSRKIEKGQKIYERCGTPAYIAPEIYKKIGYTGFQSDVWSAGVTLYYILSGNLPFKGTNIHELENAILLGEYKKIKDISYEANDIIDKMLKLEPKERITIDEILKHPWLKNVNLENRHKLNIFTKSEKKVLSKYYVDYLTSSKADLLENFTYRNLTIEKNQKKLGGNTKSVIYAPYNTCVNENEYLSKRTKYNIMSYLSKEEAILYNELEVKNDICKFGWRVRQANINYELSNNDDYDNGLFKSINYEQNYDKNTDENNSENEDITLESIKDYEKIQIDDNILEYIENKIGFDKKYLIRSIKKNIINYATATYYIKLKEKMNEKNKTDFELFDD